MHNEILTIKNYESALPAVIHIVLQDRSLRIRRRLGDPVVDPDGGRATRMDDDAGVCGYRRCESSDAGTDRYQLRDVRRLYGYRQRLGQRADDLGDHPAEPDHHADDMQDLFLAEYAFSG